MGTPMSPVVGFISEFTVQKTDEFISTIRTSAGKYHANIESIFCKAR